VVLGAFLVMKAGSDPWIIFIAFAGIAAITGFEKFYLARIRLDEKKPGPEVTDHANHRA